MRLKSTQNCGHSGHFTAVKGAKKKECCASEKGRLKFARLVQEGVVPNARYSTPHKTLQRFTEFI